MGKTRICHSLVPFAQVIQASSLWCYLFNDFSVHLLAVFLFPFISLRCAFLLISTSVQLLSFRQLHFRQCLCHLPAPPVGAVSFEYEESLEFASPPLCHFLYFVVPYGTTSWSPTVMFRVGRLLRSLTNVEAAQLLEADLNCFIILEYSMTEISITVWNQEANILLN